MRQIIIIICILGMLALLLASCSQATASTTGKNDTPSTGIPSEIIVQLKKAGDLDALLRTFEPYRLEKLKTIAPNPPLFLVTYNGKTIGADEMLSQLQGDPRVLKAEFNKKLSGRDGEK